MTQIEQQEKEILAARALAKAALSLREIDEGIANELRVNQHNRILDLEAKLTLSSEELSKSRIAGLRELRKAVEVAQELSRRLLEATGELVKARAVCIQYQSLIKSLDAELSDGEHGPHETICKMAEVMQGYLRMGHPGQVILDQLSSADDLREAARSLDLTQISYAADKYDKVRGAK